MIVALALAGISNCCACAEPTTCAAVTNPSTNRLQAVRYAATAPCEDRLRRASRLGGTSEDRNETLADSRHDKPARLQHIAFEEMSGEDKTRSDIAFADSRSIINQEGRQLEQLVAIRPACVA